MDARLAVLDAPDMQGSRSAELHLRPFQVADLGCPQPVPEGDQDQGGVPVTVATMQGGLHEPLNLGHGKIIPATATRRLGGGPELTGFSDAA
jgi:hypothetical protein